MMRSLLSFKTFQLALATDSAQTVILYTSIGTAYEIKLTLAVAIQVPNSSSRCIWKLSSKQWAVEVEKLVGPSAIFVTQCGRQLWRRHKHVFCKPAVPRTWISSQFTLPEILTKNSGRKHTTGRSNLDYSTFCLFQHAVLRSLEQMNGVSREFQNLKVWFLAAANAYSNAPFSTRWLMAADHDWQGGWWISNQIQCTMPDNTGQLNSYSPPWMKKISWCRRWSLFPLKYTSDGHKVNEKQWHAARGYQPK